ncbi:ArsR family transcriptional regulator [Methanococcus aeolicus]|uniref:Regulatory protein ArsR n=1 Tax=Methanococcus aeolicus (strain ATCC BAA-1280 / DSM 17508 / OCM 812 / Nankai-3) TaxID=419665 RepID=A6UW52_META3|nr:ArsR family transcriptional regulator [Methanococcus aeolicus]ABR56724.1 regulatory protein ArsR [Methanococcus aeolicus Nankai-3]UXM84726.1 ArsR family transcriptional regulator [Methanococcus aeolicus]
MIDPIEFIQNASSITKKSMNKLKLKTNPFSEKPIRGNTKFFVGRTTELIEIADILGAAQYGSISNAAIVGTKGIGKSSLLNVIYYAAKRQNHWTVELEASQVTPRQFLIHLMYGIIRDNIFAMDGTLSTDYMEHSQKIIDIYRRLESFSDKTPVHYPREKIERDLDYLLNNVKEEGKLCIILIDEADQFAKKSCLGLLQFFHSFLYDEGILSFFAGSPTLMENLTKVSPAMRDRFPKIINMPPLSKEEAYDLILRRLKDAQTVKANGYDPFTENAINTIVEECDGIPRRIIMTCSESISIGLKKGLTEIDENIVKTAMKKLGISIGHQILNHLTPAQSKIIKALAESGGKSTVTELAKILNNSPGTIGTHLSDIYEMGYIYKDRSGSNVYYILSKELKDVLIPEEENL